MKIDDLLAKYFEGETTCEEEKELRRLFKDENVPEELEMYRPLFAFFDQESRPRSIVRNGFKRTIIYTLGGIAAAILLIAGSARVHKLFVPSTDYVIIDGHKSVDIHLVREQALAAFDDVSFTREEIFETLFNE